LAPPIAARSPIDWSHHHTSRARSPPLAQANGRTAELGSGKCGGCKVRTVSSLFWKDGSAAQHTINVKIKHKPYVIPGDEGGTPASAATRQTVCDLGFIPFPLARIIDTSDETKPKVVSKLMDEVPDHANCDKVVGIDFERRCGAPDIAGLSIFSA